MLAARTGQKVEFSETAMLKAREILSRYPSGIKQKSALIPILHLAQEEFGNWLSVEVMEYVARLLNIQPIEVYDVATFYSMFNLKRVGRCVLEVCHTTPCAIRGAEKLVDHLQKRLGIKVGETTPDGLFTIKTVECLAACGYAPMMQVGEVYYEFLDNEEKVDRLLDELRKKAEKSN